MSFTANEIANIGNALLDFHIKGPALDQTIQDKPLYDALRKKKKMFPGGKDFITKNVKGVRGRNQQGFSHNDTVTYRNPANIKQASTSWYEVHDGIEVTLTELKKAGISVVDSSESRATSSHSQQEKVEITNLFDDKISDLTEGWAEDMNEMYWRDGTQDAKKIPGITSFILDDPTVAGTTFGIDRTLNPWWRNRAVTGINVSTPANLNLVNTLQKEFRQLRRYRGKPDLFLAGADFIEALEQELRSKGNYTDSGWAVSADGKNARFEASMADISFKGVPVRYDPTLDDLLKSKYGYWLDSNAIRAWCMEGEEMKQHNPSRPADQYVMYRALTHTGGVLAQQLNSSGVYTIA